MASHYDFYESLELDKNSSTVDLRATLSQRLEQLTAEGADDSDPKFHELSTARTILGEQVRRKKYDDRLADDSAAAIQISDLVHLADYGEFPGASNYSWTKTAQDSSDSAAQMSAVSRTFSIETRKVEEVEPTGKPIARFKLAPAVMKIAIITAIILVVYLVYSVVDMSFDLAGSDDSDLGSGMVGFQTAYNQQAMIALAVAAFLNSVWGVYVARACLSFPRANELFYIWCLTGAFAIIDFALFINATDVLVLFVPCFLAHVVVIILLSLRATRRWFDGYVENRVAVS